MKILTCNLRGFGEGDGVDAWIHRKEWCIEVIKSQTPDIICFQEMAQIADMTAAFPEYDSYGIIDEPCGDRPTNTIFYRHEGFTQRSAGGYWLSETPHVPGSKSWESQCVRLANWVTLEDRATGKEFRVVNTHLDHIGQDAREQQAKLIVEDSSAYPEDYPQILTGDMNCDSINWAIDTFKAGGWIDTYGTMQENENPCHTYHAFLGPDDTTEYGKIDWIFGKEKIQTVDAAIITESRNNRYPSDHYFVSATLNVG